MQKTCFLRLRGCRQPFESVSPDQLYYILADNVNCRIVCRNCSFAVRHPLWQLQELLPEYFLRIHRSVLINPGYVRQIYRYTVEFADFHRLDLSAAKCRELRERIGSVSQT